MKKFKHEAELFKAALLAGVAYAEGRKAVEFESTDSASSKALYVYRLLVHDMDCPRDIPSWSSLPAVLRPPIGVAADTVCPHCPTYRATRDPRAPVKSRQQNSICRDAP